MSIKSESDTLVWKSALSFVIEGRYDRRDRLAES